MSQAARLGRALAGALAAAHVSQGIVLLALPRTVMRLLRPGGIPPVWILRVLGLRMLIQGLVDVAYPRRRTMQAGVAVDVTHAVSMLAAARIWPTCQRAALLSAAAAATSVVVGVAAAAGLKPSPSGFVPYPAAPGPRNRQAEGQSARER